MAFVFFLLLLFGMKKERKKRRQKEGGWLIERSTIKPYLWQLCSFADKIQMDVSSRPTM